MIGEIITAGLVLLIFGKRLFNGPAAPLADVLPTFQQGFETALGMWSRLHSSFIMGSTAVVQAFVDQFINANDRNDYLNRIQAVEDLFQFLGDSPETEFSRPLVLIVTSRTACPCGPNTAFRDHTDGITARTPLINIGVPEVGETLPEKILADMRGRDEESQCNRCENNFTITTTTLFFDAPDILFVSVQRRIPLGNNTYRKETRPIDVSGDLTITLQSGEIATYSIRGGVEHTGPLDDNGHYYAILHHNGAYLVVDQHRQVIPSAHGLANGQMFIYKRMN